MEGPKLEWMYRNSNEVVDTEEYLLGRPIDKAFEQSQASFSNEIEKDCLPTSIFANTGSNVQVDVVRKLKEDPLEIIRLQEIERRKQLLKNPVKLKKLQTMLNVKESSKKSKEKKQKCDDDSSDIDKLLASKYLKIMKKHGIKSLSELSNMKVEKKNKHSKKNRKNVSDSSSSSSESETNEEETRKHKGNPTKKKLRISASSDSSDGYKKRHYHSNKSRETDKNFKETSYKSSHSRSISQRTSSDKDRTEKSKVSDHKTFNKREKSHLDSRDNRNKKKSNTLSDIDKQKRLEEMMENAKWRDEVRIKNVARYKKEQSSEKMEAYNEDFIRKQMVLATSHGSVESRIKSNINNIQKSKFSMNENFARR